MPHQTDSQTPATNPADASSEPEPRLTTRSIRSFVIRKGRLTKAQEIALNTLKPRYCIPYSSSLLDPANVFSQSSPIWLEIGFGNGDALIDMALRYPHVNFIGIEVHEPGVGQALMGIEKHALQNVRIIQHDAMEVLGNMIASDSLERVLLFFPDPWRKKRHFKRRIVNAEFLNLVADKLKQGGVLHCATDWENYAEWMLEKLHICTQLTNSAPSGQYAERPEWRAKTKFEQRGERLGHQVVDLLYRKD